MFAEIKCMCLIFIFLYVYFFGMIFKGKVGGSIFPLSTEHKCHVVLCFLRQDDWTKGRKTVYEEL